MKYEVIPQKIYTIDGIPAGKFGEWPGIKSNHWKESKMIIQPVKFTRIFDDNLYELEKNRRHFKEKFGYERAFKPMSRQFIEEKYRVNIEDKPKGLKHINMTFSDNKTVYDKKHFPERRGFEKYPQPFYIRTYKPDQNYTTTKETTLEKTIGSKKRIYSLDQQRNGLQMKSPGDKFYKTSEQFPNYYKEGGLIPGSTNRINFNKTQSKKAYNFYETLDLSIPTLDKTKIWKNKIKAENLEQDKNYVTSYISSWENNILKEFAPDYCRKKGENPEDLLMKPEPKMGKKSSPNKPNQKGKKK